MRGRGCEVCMPCFFWKIIGKLLEMRKYHKWRKSDEDEIRRWYEPRRWWGEKDLAVQLGVTIDALECHVRVMKRRGEL